MGDRQPVSRVLSAHENHLSYTGRSFLSAFGHPNAPAAYPRLDALRHPCETGRLSPLIWPCSDWGLPSHRRYRQGGGLLPHRFTLTPVPAEALAEAVCFLLHCPSREARAARAQALPGSLPCGARTFLGSACGTIATVRLTTTRLQYTNDRRSAVSRRSLPFNAE